MPKCMNIDTSRYYMTATIVFDAIVFEQSSTKYWTQGALFSV